jgi:amino acid transporter
MLATRRPHWPGRLVGLLAVMAGIVSAAAPLNGFVGYLQEFVQLDRVTIIVATGVLLCAVAAWGIGESVRVAGIISIAEVAGLLWITALSIASVDPAGIDPGRLLPEASLESWSFITAGAMLAFYAYVGFEDMIEVAEEVRALPRNLPRAIFLTPAVSTLIYLLLVTSTILAIGPETLADSPAPLPGTSRRHLSPTSTGD